jgi:hypothetical protein
MLNQSQAVIACTVGGLTILATLVGCYVRWARPGFRQARSDFIAARDSIVGRDAVVDSITGRELSPALPGVGVRLDRQEQQMDLLTGAVSKIADSHVRLEDHEHRIMQLEAAAVERVVARAESAQAWRAMEKAMDSPPPEDN